MDTIRKSMTSTASPELGWRAFVGEVAERRPLDTRSVCAGLRGAPAVKARVTAEPRGEIAEEDAAGDRDVRGAVHLCEARRRRVRSWRPFAASAAASAAAQTVALTIEPRDEGCEISLEHGGRETRGEAGPEAPDGCDRGRDPVRAICSGRLAPAAQQQEAARPRERRA